MHPGMIAWWAARERARHGGECGSHVSDERGPRGHGRGHGPFARPDWHGADDAGFGVRRPLRFLAHKLDLDDKQSAELARILDRLKTERAQAAVDERRTLSALADAMAGDTFDRDAAGAAGDRRVRTAEALRGAVLEALTAIHALLRAEQREQFAYLVRSGVLSL